MGLTLSGATEVMKTDYLPPVREQLENANVLMKRLRKNEEDVVGKEALVPLHIARNHGIGVRAEQGTLPTAGAQSYKSATFGMTHHYGRIQITGQTIKAMRNDTGAFVRALDSEMKGIVTDLKRDVQRQLWGDGSGVIATVVDTEASTTLVTCDNVYMIEPGMILDASLTATNAGEQTYRTVVAVNRILNTVEFTDSAAKVLTVTTQTTAFYRHGNWQKEMYGIDAAVSTSNVRQDADASYLKQFGGISRAAAAGAFWKCNAVTAAAHRALSLDLMQQAVDKSEIAGADLSVGLCDYLQFRAYANTMLPDRRFDSSMTLDGGYKALDYGGLPIVRDKFCPPGKMYFLDESTLQIYHMGDWDWMDKDGAILCRVANKDEYEATIYRYMNLGGDRGNANTVLCDLSLTI